MKLRSPLLIRSAALGLATFLRVLAGSTRKHYHSFDEVEHPADARKGRYLYCFWHENIAMAAVQNAKIRVLISQHSDGELITRAAYHLGRGAIRGSSTRGGSAALLEMIRSIGNYHLGVTPDGPKGPRRKVQIGLPFVASQTGLPVVPFGIGYNDWCFRAKSWDRFAIPYPGSMVTFVSVPRIIVPANLSRAEVRRYCMQIEASLNWASEAADLWAKTGRRPKEFPRELLAARAIEPCRKAS